MTRMLYCTYIFYVGRKAAFGGISSHPRPKLMNVCIQAALAMNHKIGFALHQVAFNYEKARLALVLEIDFFLSGNRPASDGPPFHPVARLHLYYEIAPVAHLT